MLVLEFVIQAKNPLDACDIIATFRQEIVKVSSFRIVSFLEFPFKANKIVDSRLLAKFGFMYTGFNDRVKCFSCHRCIENFKISNHNTGPINWHKKKCAFRNGLDPSNKPIDVLH